MKGKAKNKLNPELGQVWTPDNISLEMANLVYSEIKKDKIKILDPASGPGTFSRALNGTGLTNFSLTCYEIEKSYSSKTKKINKELGIKGNTLNSDYLLDQTLENNFNAVISNPPYIRHEKIPKARKDKYLIFLEKYYKNKIDRRSNIYVLFLLKSIIDLKQDGIMVAIVYDSITESNYGKKAMSLIEPHAVLKKSKTILAPFKNTLIDAKIITFKKCNAKKSKSIKNNYKRKTSTHVPLGSLLNIKRGTSFSKREIFLCNDKSKLNQYAENILIKQATLKNLLVTPDKKVFFLSRTDQVKKKDLLEYLTKIAENKGINNLNFYHNKVSGNIIFNYYIRNNPRHLWNPNLINVSDNFYASYPENNFPAILAWLLLNSDTYNAQLLLASRNQGNGLRKLQLFEYKSALVPDWNKITLNQLSSLKDKYTNLIGADFSITKIRKLGNELLKECKL